MSFIVPRDVKARTARYGPTRIFGDPDKREGMGDNELVELFDKSWIDGLGAAVEAWTRRGGAEVSKRLSDAQRKFFRPVEVHGETRYRSMELVVQAKQLGESDFEVSQIWKVQSGDDYPKTVWVTFDTVEERMRFRKVAEFLGKEDDALARSLLRDFMGQFGNLLYPDE